MRELEHSEAYDDIFGDIELSDSIMYDYDEEEQRRLEEERRIELEERFRILDETMPF